MINRSFSIVLSIPTCFFTPGAGGPPLFHEARDAGVPIVAGFPTASLAAAAPNSSASREDEPSPPNPRRLGTDLSLAATPGLTPSGDATSIADTWHDTPTTGDAISTPNTEAVEVVDSASEMLPDNQLGDTQVNPPENVDEAAGGTPPLSPSPPPEPLQPSENTNSPTETEPALKAQAAAPAQATASPALAPHEPEKSSPMDSANLLGNEGEKTKHAAAPRDTPTNTAASSKPSPSDPYSDGSYWKTLALQSRLQLQHVHAFQVWFGIWCV